MMPPFEEDQDHSAKNPTTMGEQANLSPQTNIR